MPLIPLDGTLVHCHGTLGLKNVPSALDRSMSHLCFTHTHTQVNTRKDKEEALWHVLGMSDATYIITSGGSRYLLLRHPWPTFE